MLHRGKDGEGGEDGEDGLDNSVFSVLSTLSTSSPVVSVGTLPVPVIAEEAILPPCVGIELLHLPLRRRPLACSSAPATSCSGRQAHAGHDPGEARIPAQRSIMSLNLDHLQPGVTLGGGTFDLGEGPFTLP